MSDTERCELDEAKCQHCFDEVFKRKDTNPMLSKLLYDYLPNKQKDHNDLIVCNYTGGTFTCENKLRDPRYFYYNFNNPDVCTGTTLMETDKENGGTQVFVNFFGDSNDGWKKFIIQFIPQIDIAHCPLKEINPRNSFNSNENKWRRFVPYDVAYIFKYNEDTEAIETIHTPNKSHKLYKQAKPLEEDGTYDGKVWEKWRKKRIAELQAVADRNNLNIKLLN